MLWALVPLHLMKWCIPRLTPERKKFTVCGDVDLWTEKTTTIKQSIGADDFKRGKIDTAGAVQISGISLGERNNVYVRGLEIFDTYWSLIYILMMEKENINLNLFPSDVIQYVSVSAKLWPQFRLTRQGYERCLQKRYSRKRDFLACRVNAWIYFQIPSQRKEFWKVKRTNSDFCHLTHCPFLCHLSMAKSRKYWREPSQTGQTFLPAFPL
jgi:hypothetical protein